MNQDASAHDEEATPDPKLPPDPARRFWVAAACTMGGMAGIATAIPFVRTLAPSNKARAAGAPVEVDIADLAPNELRTIEWRGKPVWIMRRTDEQLKGIRSQNSLVADPHSERPGFTPSYAKNTYRSRKPDLLVCVGLCTHLGCSPIPRFETGPADNLPASWQGGFLCPCHGSSFDLAGRVYKNEPAPDNLEVPPYQYLTQTRLVVGIDEDSKA